MATLVTAVLVSLLVTRIATVWLTVTGMPREAARFQARSAFTGVGFTTSESEQLVNHPVRRRVVMFLMLLGNAGVVAVAGSAIVGLGGQSTPRETLLRTSVALAGLAAVWILSKSSRFDNALSRYVARYIKRHYGTEVHAHAELLRIAGDWQVAEVLVRPGDWLSGRAVGDVRLRDEGVTILGIVRPGGGYLPWPAAGTLLEPGQTLIVYAHGSRLVDLDERQQGALGQRAHEHAAAEHAQAKGRDDRLGEAEE